MSLTNSQRTYTLGAAQHFHHGLLVAVLIIPFLGSGAAWGVAGCPAGMDGDGDANSPCQIITVAQLQSVSTELTLNYQLQNDLDLSGLNWQPIGDLAGPFRGQFNGQGFIISNLIIDRPDENYIGLFGATEGAVINNIGLEAVHIVGLSVVGGLVGSNRGDVSTSYAIGKVTSEQETGGLVGRNAGNVSNSFATVEVTGISDDGGLVGWNQGNVSNSYATGKVTARTAGGLIGSNTGTVLKSFANVSVIGEVTAGGLVGSNSGEVQDSYATGSVHVTGGSNPSAGGLVGRNANKGNVDRSYASGAVSGISPNLGGLIGNNNDDGNVENSFWDREATNQNSAIGFDGNGTATNVVGGTTADMTTYATFDAAWNSATQVIVDGWQAPNNPSWGICELTNDGYPFLLWEFDSNPCLPDAPTAVTAVRGDGQATVSWTAPVGSGLTYTVTAMPGGLTCTTTGTSCVIEGLTNGTEYTFTVVANNTSGAGPASALSVAVTPASPPSVPLDIQVTPSINRFQVTWTAPLNNGGTPIVRYAARANPSCEVLALPNEVPGETQYSCELINLDPEQTYQVFVSAVNEAGETEAAALGGGSDNTPASFAPNPIIVVPVNSPWALMVLVLMMVGLVVTFNRRRPDWLAGSQSNTHLGL